MRRSFVATSETTNTVAGMTCQVTRYGLHYRVMRDLETNALMSP